MTNMMFLKLKKFLNIYLLIFFSSQLFINSKVLELRADSSIKGEESIFKKTDSNEEEINKLDPNYLQRINKDNFYILGGGDKFYLRLSDISARNVPLLDGSFIVDPEGLTTLPRLRRVR